MRTTHSLLLCILGAALICAALCNNANGPDRCCFRFHQTPVNKKFITSYILTDVRCPKAGVIFNTRKNRTLCADPELPWVQSIIAKLDKESF
ncbi:C-C motif chemokine 3 [Nothobranchius furzeri]|uniref:C-C motif chemokine 3-like n=1 Tax=Nothobranchius furzeri TaxID=105023 RepID=A0A8C6LC38_NOTFU|nr:C-C motif chemokine 36.1 isoform X2 [Nothobranchius furzeri]KAF7216248.1 C-C motif chemokine 3-like [Nothobranchius furzeri]